MKIKIDRDLIIGDNVSPCISISAESRDIHAYLSSDSSTSLAEYDGRAVSFPLPHYTKADALETQVRGKVFMALASQLCDATEIFWDGSDWKGHRKEGWY